MKPPAEPHPVVRSTFALPVIIGLASTVGLVAALVGDGWMDALSWLGLAAPVLAISWAMTRRR